MNAIRAVSPLAATTRTAAMSSLRDQSSAPQSRWQEYFQSRGDEHAAEFPALAEIQSMQQQSVLDRDAQRISRYELLAMNAPYTEQQRSQRNHTLLTAYSEVAQTPNRTSLLANMRA